MSLLSGLTPPLKETKCPVIKVAEKLSKEDQTILLAAIANYDWSINKLWKELSRRGLVLSRVAMTAHRNNDCACNA